MLQGLYDVVAGPFLLNCGYKGFVNTNQIHQHRPSLEWAQLFLKYYHDRPQPLHIPDEPATPEQSPAKSSHHKTSRSQRRCIVKHRKKETGTIDYFSIKKV